jgi:hypothetical protein
VTLRIACFERTAVRPTTLSRSAHGVSRSARDCARSSRHQMIS